MIEVKYKSTFVKAGNSVQAMRLWKSLWEDKLVTQKSASSAQGGQG